MKKVVIIDDSLTQLNVAKLMFEKNHWTVCAIDDARRALDVIFRFVPDIIITDAIMPNTTGFDLVKEIRKNEYISKIPTLVYSILSENNAKFYVKEERDEYFLRKNENIEELLKLATEIVDAHPLSENYKKEILKAGYEMRGEIPDKKETPNTEKLHNPTKDDAKRLLVKNYNFSYDDNTLFEEVFETLSKLLDYDIGLIYVDVYSETKRKLYLDPRHVILSPIMQNTVLSQYDTENVKIFKKSSQNSRTVTTEKDLPKVLEFDFGYNDKDIAKIKFYTRKENKWKDDDELLQAVKDGLFYFLRARHIYNNGAIRRKSDSFSQSTDTIKNLQNFVNGSRQNAMYLAILNIRNYSDIKSKASTKNFKRVMNGIYDIITRFLDETEQIKKDNDNEFSIIIFARNKNQALGKLNYIVNAINALDVDGIQLDSVIAASACEAGSGLNTYETEKKVRNLMDKISPEERAVIG